MNKRIAPRALATFAGLSVFLLVGCEGGRLDGATPATSRAADLLPVEDGRGIQADLAEGTHAYRGDMRVTIAGDNVRDLHVVNQASDEDAWAISAIPAELGEYRCDAGGLTITLMRGGQPTLDSLQGGSCALTVTQANLRRIEGHFSGVLTGPNGNAHAMDNGVFRFELAHAIPDSDADGYSDADDNCVFNANPDQADGNGNGVGTACDGSEQE